MDQLELQLQALAAQTEVRMAHLSGSVLVSTLSLISLIDRAGPAEQTGSCQVAAVLLLLITRGLAASPPAKL